MPRAGDFETVISLVAVFLFTAASVFANPAAVVDQVRTWRAAHEVEILSEFVELLAIPNLATDATNIRRNADRDPRDVREARSHDDAARTGRSTASDRG